MGSTDHPKMLSYFKVFASFSGHLVHLRHQQPRAGLILSKEEEEVGKTS